MADTKISDETSAGTLTGSELIPAVQAGSNVKLTPSSIVNDLAILTYDAVDNAIDYPPGTTILDLDTIGGAPVSAQYALVASDVALPNARVLSNSTTVTVNTSVAGQIQLRTVATTGDVTKPANSTINTIANDVVSNAKLTNMAANTVKVNNTAADADPADLALAANQLLGRGSTGDIAPITLGTGLTMTGTTISASATGLGSNSAAYKFRFSTSVDQVDPGASYIRLDNAAQSIASNFVISATDADANGMTGVLGLIKKNYRMFFKSVDPARSSFIEMIIKSVELVGATHYLINYTRMASKAFINDEYVWVTFSPNSGFYLDPDDERIKRWSDNSIMDGPLLMTTIAAALSSPSLDTTVSTKHGMTATVEDPGNNSGNALLEYFPWAVQVSSVKNRLELIGGYGRLVKTKRPVRVTVPADGLTWTVSDVGGKVRISAASHLLSALESNTYTYLVNKTAQNGWAANSLHLVTNISGNDVDLGTDFGGQGNPDFYAPGEAFTFLSFNIPALREFSEVEGKIGLLPLSPPGPRTSSASISRGNPTPPPP